MRILVVLVVKNERRLIPWALRHYDFADTIHVFDNESTDGTAEFLDACGPKVRRIPYSTGGVLRDDVHSAIKSIWYKFQAGYDWVITGDCDELLYCDRGVRVYLQECMDKGIVLPRTSGYNMCGDGFPEFSRWGGISTLYENVDFDKPLPKPTVQHRYPNLTDLVTEGVEDANYSKRCVFSTKLDMQWGAGCHPHDTRVNGSLVPRDHDVVQGGENLWFRHHEIGAVEPELKLLHYRWWSPEDAAKKANGIVLSEYNIKNQLGVHGQTDPDHEIAAYHEARAKRTKVI